jgi:ribosome-binding factor A
MRYVPRLRFAHDATLDRATRVGELIDAALRHDGDPSRQTGEEC